MNDANTDDVTLIRRVARADTDALSELYSRYHRLVFSLALAMVRERTLAEEIMLDVYVHIWQGAETYRPELGKVSTWLSAITRHRAIDVLRRLSARPESKSVSWDQLPPQAAFVRHDLAEGAEQSWQRARIRDALAQLPQEQLEVLSLAYFQGYSHQQISSVLRQPLGTVKTRIRLAMQKLRRALSSEQSSSNTSSHAPAAYHIDEAE